MNRLLLTIDVEDWFQVENFRQIIPFSSWPGYDLRVEQSTHRILDLLDSSTFGQGTGSSKAHPSICSSPRATFFVLGWIGERLPGLVREIQERGHEVASHGYNHFLCNRMPLPEVTTDLEESKKLLEDILGKPVYGYRAPSFSINAEVLELVEACGYLYDSSFNSFSSHGRYGELDLSGCSKHGIVARISESFFEIPISNLEVGARVIPWGGGGYFRLIPFPLFKPGVRSILQKSGAYVFYLHPWEVDPDQPKVRNASRAYRFRHYLNLRRSLERLRTLITAFRDCRFVTCSQYLREMTKDV